MADTSRLSAQVHLRPWYRLSVPVFLRCYREHLWRSGRVRSLLLAFYVARLTVTDARRGGGLSTGTR
jgi:hypothetical protein